MKDKHFPSLQNYSNNAICLGRFGELPAFMICIYANLN